MTGKSLANYPRIRRIYKSKLWIFGPIYILVAPSHNRSWNKSEFSCCWSVSEPSKITSSKVTHFLLLNYKIPSSWKQHNSIRRFWNQNPSSRNDIYTVLPLTYSIHISGPHYSSDNFLLLHITRMNERKFKLHTHTYIHTHTHTHTYIHIHTHLQYRPTSQ